LRDRQKEYERRNVQPLIVMAQHPFQLKHPGTIDKGWEWPSEVPAAVLFDPVSTVSATYGVAFQTQFRDGSGAWSSQPSVFVIDPDGVIRHAQSRPNQDIRERDFFPVLDDLTEQRRLIAALQSDPALREASRLALAPPSPRSKTAIPVLGRALKDESAQVRAGAAAALYWMAARAGPAIPALTTALRDSDARVRRLASMALGRIGPAAGEAAQPLARVLADSDVGVRTAAGAALRQIGLAAAPGVTEVLKKDSDPRVRSAAAAALPGLASNDDAHRQFRETLLAALADREAPVRVAAANALFRVRMGPGDATLVLPPLTTALKDSDARVRGPVAELLGRLGSRAVPVLRGALKDRVGRVRSHAAFALSRIGPDASPAVPALIEALKDEVVEVRTHAALALGAAGQMTPAVLAALKKALQDDAQPVRNAATQALKKLDPPR
jgi:HEAT repeat protein